MARTEEGPDQARSWVIAMAGFVICILLSGISRTTGLFYVALIETYGVTRMEANMPFAVRNVVRNLGSPVAGIVGQRYGARSVTFIGGVLSALGIALCCFSPDLTWITILWGGMHGFGAALGNTLFPVVINQHFLKHRATASGLSFSGACFGSFVFPSLFQKMLTEIGLPGTFLIAGGILMHMLPPAVMMSEPSWVKRRLPGRHTTRNEVESPSVIESKENAVTEKQSDAVSVSIMKRLSLSVVVCDEVKKSEDEIFQPMTRSTRVFSRNGVDNPAFMGSKSDIRNKVVEHLEDNFCKVRARTISVGETSLALPEHLVYEEQETSLSKGIIRVIKDPMFHVISLTLAGFAMLFDPAITVIVDYIRDKGLQEDDAKYFIIMMSVGDLLGRLCFGWVTDRGYMSVPRFMLLILVLQGACFIIMPLFRTFGILMTVIMIYGMASGASLVMFPILVAKYLVSVQSLAIGGSTVLTGILSFAIPPIIGYFRDNAGSYDGMFIITGSLSVAAGLLWLFEPFFVRVQESQRSDHVTVIS